MPTPPSALERRLGSYDAAAIIVSNVIGGTILFAPPFMAGLVPNPFLYLGLWVAGGALAFAGAMAYAELAALKPKAGGEYVYLDAAYGRLAAFLTGWTSFVAGFAGAIAANAFFIPIYLAGLCPASTIRPPLHDPDSLRPPDVFDAHARGSGLGMAPGRHSHSRRRSRPYGHERAGSTEGRRVPAVHRRRPRVRHRLVRQRHRIRRFPGDGQLAVCLHPGDARLLGVERVAYVAEEIRDPGRNLPRSLALGTIAVTAIYLGVNVLYLYVFSVRDLAALKGSVLDVVAERLLGSGAGHVMGIVSIVSLLAGNSAMTFAGPRVYFAMARDDVFFKAASQVHPVYRTPAFAIVAQTIWTTLLILSGSGNALITYPASRSRCSWASPCSPCSCCAGASRTPRGRSRR